MNTLKRFIRGVMASAQMAVLFGQIPIVFAAQSGCISFVSSTDTNTLQRFKRTPRICSARAAHLQSGATYLYERLSAADTEMMHIRKQGQTGCGEARLSGRYLANRIISTRKAV